MSDTPTTTTTPEGLVCETPPDASVPLPPRYTLVKGRPTPVAETAQVEVLSTQQVVDGRLQDLRSALLQVGYRLPDTTANALWLVMQRADVTEGKPTKAKPYNAKDVPAGARALLDLLEEMPEMGKLLGVEAEPLMQALARVAFLASLREAIAWTLPLIETHEAHALSDLADIVGPTVEAVQSLLPRYPRMATLLKDAILYKKGPADLAQQTREGNAKVASEAREDERSKLVAPPPQASATPVVVAPVVVPQPTTPAMTAAPAPASGPQKKR